MLVTCWRCRLSASCPQAKLQADCNTYDSAVAADKGTEHGARRGRGEEDQAEIRPGSEPQRLQHVFLQRAH